MLVEFKDENYFVGTKIPVVKFSNKYSVFIHWNGSVCTHCLKQIYPYQSTVSQVLRYELHLNTTTEEIRGESLEQCVESSLSRSFLCFKMLPDMFIHGDESETYEDIYICE